MKKLKIPYPIIITAAVLAIAVMAVFSNFFIYPRRTIISTISKYEKTIKFAKTEEVNIDNRLSHFPDKIPDGAKNAEFTFMTRYNGTFCYLKFKTTPEAISEYLDYYQNNAEWIGKQSNEEAEKNGAAIDKVSNTIVFFGDGCYVPM